MCGVERKRYRSPIGPSDVFDPSPCLDGHRARLLCFVRETARERERVRGERRRGEEQGTGQQLAGGGRTRRGERASAAGFCFLSSCVINKESRGRAAGKEEVECGGQRCVAAARRRGRAEREMEQGRAGPVTAALGSSGLRRGRLGHNSERTSGAARAAAARVRDEQGETVGRRLRCRPACGGRGAPTVLARRRLLPSSRAVPTAMYLPPSPPQEEEEERRALFVASASGALGGEAAASGAAASGAR